MRRSRALVVLGQETFLFVLLCSAVAFTKGERGGENRPSRPNWPLLKKFAGKCTPNCRIVCLEGTYSTWEHKCQSGTQIFRNDIQIQNSQMYRVAKAHSRHNGVYACKRDVRDPGTNCQCAFFATSPVEGNLCRPLPQFSAVLQHAPRSERVLTINTGQVLTLDCSYIVLKTDTPCRVVLTHDSGLSVMKGVPRCRTNLQRAIFEVPIRSSADSGVYTCKAYQGEHNVIATSTLSFTVTVLPHLPRKLPPLLTSGDFELHPFEPSAEELYHQVLLSYRLNINISLRTTASTQKHVILKAGSGNNTLYQLDVRHFLEPFESCNAVKALFLSIQAETVAGVGPPSDVKALEIPPPASHLVSVYLRLEPMSACPEHRFPSGFVQRADLYTSALTFFTIALSSICPCCEVPQGFVLDCPPGEANRTSVQCSPLPEKRFEDVKLKLSVTTTTTLVDLRDIVRKLATRQQGDTIDIPRMWGFRLVSGAITMGNASLPVTHNSVVNYSCEARNV